jgi:formamidopyrimidine-DNA glycosylase
MPELPEVETVVRRLQSSLLDKKIQKVQILTPKIVRPASGRFTKELQGAIIREIRRKGKFILMDLDPEGTLVLHLKMTGQVLLVNKSEPIDQYTHLIFSFFSSAQQMRYRDVRKFGFFDLVSGLEAGIPPYLNKVGPDPFELSPKEFFQLIHKHNKTIKGLLLDQSVVSGLGNIYVDESLYLTGMHPQIKASSLSPGQAKNLFRNIKKILLHAIRHQGSTLRNFRSPDGSAGGYQRFHRVYRRGGQPCPLCQTPIQRIIVAGRGTHYCASCQKPQ